jgi:probable rRNA maturation factor
VLITVLDETGGFRRRERLTAVLQRVAAVAAPARRGATGRDAPLREVTVVLVSDATIAARNLADRGVAGPTDVLAYPLNEPDDAGVPRSPHLGDVVISLDTAARQARSRGRPTWHEVAVLASHGLLHLLGLDHQAPEDWAPFEALQGLAEAEAEAVDRAGVARRSLRTARLVT